MLIQILLLIAVAGLLVGFIRWEHGIRVQAGKRLAFFAFLLLNAYAVLRPNDVTAAAHLVGVGRGTDLVLYLLVVGFAFVVLNVYLRFRETDERLTDLARAVALREAELVNRERGLIALAARPTLTPQPAGSTGAPVADPAEPSGTPVDR